jgi:hypothetical protein
MIRTKFLKEQLRHGRLDAETLDNMFRRQIEEGENRTPFVSQAMWPIRDPALILTVWRAPLG